MALLSMALLFTQALTMAIPSMALPAMAGTLSSNALLTMAILTVSPPWWFTSTSPPLPHHGSTYHGRHPVKYNHRRTEALTADNTAPIRIVVSLSLSLSLTSA